MSGDTQLWSVHWWQPATLFGSWSRLKSLFQSLIITQLGPGMCTSNEFVIRWHPFLIAVSFTAIWQQGRYLFLEFSSCAKLLTYSRRRMLSIQNAKFFSSQFFLGQYQQSTSNSVSSYASHACLDVHSCVNSLYWYVSWRWKAYSRSQK